MWACKKATVPNFHFLCSVVWGCGVEYWSFALCVFFFQQLPLCFSSLDSKFKKPLLWRQDKINVRRLQRYVLCFQVPSFREGGQSLNRLNTALLVWVPCSFLSTTWSHEHRTESSPWRPLGIAPNKQKIFLKNLKFQRGQPQQTKLKNKNKKHLLFIPLPLSCYLFFPGELLNWIGKNS